MRKNRFRASGIPRLPICARQLPTQSCRQGADRLPRTITTCETKLHKTFTRVPGQCKLPYRVWASSFSDRVLPPRSARSCPGQIRVTASGQISRAIIGHRCQLPEVPGDDPIGSPETCGCLRRVGRPPCFVAPKESRQDVSGKVSSSSRSTRSQILALHGKSRPRMSMQEIE